MSDFSYSSRSRSSLQGGRTPLRVIQPPSSFIERVNKVKHIQIFENTKKPLEKPIESERFQSPYIVPRSERLVGTLSRQTCKSKRKSYTKKKLKVELASLKLSQLFKNTTKEAWEKIKKENVMKENELTRKNSYDTDLRRLLDDAFKKYLPSMTTQHTSMLTKCEKCGHVGLNLYTSSTKENFSPRFLDKIRQMLPSGSIKKSLSDVSTLPISDFYPDTCLISPFKDNSRDSLMNYSPDFCGNNGKIRIPKLNITDVLHTQSKTRYSEEVLKGSPIKKINEANMNSGVTKLNTIFMTRIHRSFDMIFLSRANKQNQEHSLTFEFTLEESKISNEPSTLTGTFGENQRIFEISAIQKKRDESFSSEYADGWNRGQNMKTACKILYTRLDKLFYRRKVRGFYSLVDVMY